MQNKRVFIYDTRVQYDYVRELGWGETEDKLFLFPCRIPFIDPLRPYHHIGGPVVEMTTEQWESMQTRHPKPFYYVAQPLILYQSKLTDKLTRGRCLTFYGDLLSVNVPYGGTDPWHVELERELEPVI